MLCGSDGAAGAAGASSAAFQGPAFVSGETAPDTAVLAGLDGPAQAGVNDFAAPADDLRLFGLDDEFVPVGPSVALAAKRPDLVRFEPWQTALHTKEWNTDPERWDAAVREFLTP